MTTPTGETQPSWFGHPRGLSTLFVTEMWERFSYYGMRAFLILYMVHALGFDDKHAGRIYGNYTAGVWAAAIVGGIVADWWLGQYRSVLIGGIIIALGHFTLALHPLPFFYTGLSLIVIGTGLLKPNVSGIVGALYDPGDTRRDAGFSIFYMGINLGAFIGPIIAGWLAQKVDCTWALPAPEWECRWGWYNTCWGVVTCNPRSNVWPAGRRPPPRWRPQRQRQDSWDSPSPSGNGSRRWRCSSCSRRSSGARTSRRGRA